MLLKSFRVSIWSFVLTLHFTCTHTHSDGTVDVSLSSTTEGGFENVTIRDRSMCSFTCTSVLA